MATEMRRSWRDGLQTKITPSMRNTMWWVKKTVAVQSASRISAVSSRVLLGRGTAGRSKSVGQPRRR